MAAGGVAVAAGLVATHGAAQRVSLAHCLRIVRILQVLNKQAKGREGVKEETGCYEYDGLS